jgi:hypothetical protein
MPCLCYPPRPSRCPLHRLSPHTSAVDVFATSPASRRSKPYPNPCFVARECPNSGDAPADCARFCFVSSSQPATKPSQRPRAVDQWMDVPDRVPFRVCNRSTTDKWTKSTSAVHRWSTVAPGVRSAINGADRPQPHVKQSHTGQPWPAPVVCKKYTCTL